MYICVREFNAVQFIVNCFEPMLSRGVVISSSSPVSTFEGAVIMYECGEGFQPADAVVTSVCGGDGLWTPNTAIHTCTG